MFKTYFNYFVQLILLIGLISCSNDADENSGNQGSKSSTKQSFSLVKNTGVDFVNRLTPTTKFSTFDYQYYQNGGGVVVADFNNDGLKDVFFTANQEADRLYLNKGDFKFEDITESAKVDGFGNNISNSWSTGAVACDVNKDGYMDIYVCKSGPFESGVGTQNLLYVNNRNLTFTERAKDYGIHDQGHSTQAVFFDYDKDLDLDLFVMNHGSIFGDPQVAYVKRNDTSFLKKHSSKLYKNDNGKFTDVTVGSGLLNFTYGLGLVASDFDGDNDVDIYVASDFSRPDCMYMNNGDGTFIDAIKENTGHLSFYSMGCDAADINNDGKLDISVVDMAPANNFRSKTLMPSMAPEDFKVYVDVFDYQHQYMFNSLHLNQGKSQFSEVAKLAGVHKTDWSWATLLADLDNDGLKDMFVSNGYKYNKMENDFSIEFKEMMAKYNGKIPEEVKAKWINKPPSYKLKNYAFRNINGTKFEKYSDKWGFKEKTYSNGAAYADFDNDGDLDIVLNNIDDEAYFYKNNASDINNYIQVVLQAGGRYNIALSLNAKVKLYVDDEIQFQEFSLVRGFQSSMDDVLHFGIGGKTSVDSLVVQWSDGRRQKIVNPEINQRHIVDKTKSGNSYANATQLISSIFEKTTLTGLNFEHQENEYDDFINELLLPHKNSHHGPSISIADVNGDGLDDLFVGGAMGQESQMFTQKESGGFSKLNSSAIANDRGCEDINSVFFDVDNDGDNDLYVISGGNEFDKNSNQLVDRLYLNNGEGEFTKSTFLPAVKSSGSVAVPIDVDGDSDLDIFVGGRMVPGSYPYASESYVLINEKGRFSKASDELFPSISKLGMVTDAIKADINNDKIDDLIIVGEWSKIQFIQNNNGVLEDVTPSNLTEETGWWSAIESGDFDQDGDMDFVLGNLGLNYKYQASKKEPFHIYANDFDKTGNLDIVLGYFNEGNLYPLRGRECSSEQMPFIKDKFPSYKKFATATLKDVYGEDLEKAYHLQATNFSNSILINDGAGGFTLKDLPMDAQYSCINGFIVNDFNKDGHLDLLAAGNLFVAEVETPRNDAGLGLLLLGDGKGDFSKMDLEKSGFLAKGDVKDIKLISVSNHDYILVANNDDKLEIFKFQ